jgi:hypothetical protein
MLVDLWVPLTHTPCPFRQSYGIFSIPAAIN